jgi:molybdate transport system ATP-binding protein
MLEVDIKRRVGGFALDVAFAAPTPGVVALFGVSGAGKSSVVHALAGLARPDAGRIALDGEVLFDAAAGIDVPAERRRAGVVFQDARLFPHLSVAGNLRYGWKRAAAAGRRIGFDAVVALLGIAPLLDRRPHTLSGGERQRVALGRALLAQPRLLLMDEPLASLDLQRKVEVLPYLERLRGEFGLPIVYVSHDWGEVSTLADSLVLLEQGRAVASGPLGALASRVDLPQLAGRADAGAVIDATVAGHEHARGLSLLDFPGGRLVAPQLAAPVGSALRLRVRAREVVLATEAPRGISVHNVLAGRVAGISDADGPHALVAVAVGPTRFLARITRDAVDRLGLRTDAPVHVLVKTVALDRFDT